jgi:hypothetical protein
MSRRHIFVSLFMMVIFSIAAYATERPVSLNSNLASAVTPLDGGGTYCNAATLIDSATTSYRDSGYLDMDNDCSNPFPWPYNDVFYKFKPAVSRTYIFKLQIFSPTTKAAIRIMADACCAGGTTAAWDTNNVASDCDSGATAYLRADLEANRWYWIHVGDMSPAAHHSFYRFVMLHVPCPIMESPIIHNTPNTAQVIALNDSILGDSATSGHPDWYQFTLAEPESVIISEVSREFGHCNSGWYPACLVNPLNAHFFVYCDVFGHQLGEGNGELCSTDARVAFCLPGGTYWIQVVNYGGESWVGWDYILSVITRPAGNCPPLPTACGEQLFLCPDGYDSLVTLTPNGTPPGPQHVQACVRLDTVHMTTLVVPVVNNTNMPTVHVSTACSTCVAQGCTPLEGTWSYDSLGWTFLNNPPRFINHLIANPGASGCCVCVSLDFVLPVELTSFTALAGDGHVTLNWATASELHNDHFDLERDGIPVAQVQGAGTSSQSHTYRWTDDGVTNGRDFRYTLYTVDEAGDRVVAGTVSAHPTAGPSVITEYALYQNYPNPFNPSTQISFDVAQKGFASLKIYNLMGQEVATLVNGTLDVGRHEVTFDASTLPSGIYLYRLRVNGYTADRKMLLMK